MNSYFLFSKVFFSDNNCIDGGNWEDIILLSSIFSFFNSSQFNKFFLLWRFSLDNICELQNLEVCNELISLFSLISIESLLLFNLNE